MTSLPVTVSGDVSVALVTYLAYELFRFLRSPGFDAKASRWNRPTPGAFIVTDPVKGRGKPRRQVPVGESRRNKPACNLVVFRWASLNRSSGAYRISEDFSLSGPFLSFGSINDWAVALR